MFEHILVPLDGSTRAEEALPIVARVARAAGSSVVLLQVVSFPMSYGYSSSLGLNYGYSGGLDSTLLISEEVGETEQTEAAAYLTRIAHSDLFAGITTTTEVVFGLPAAPHILALVEQQAVNLIVLCSHGRTGFLRWVLGSVAQQVIHHSRVPVLVLREGGAALPALHAGAAHSLCAAVALDGSPLAETALLPAAHLVAALAQPAQGVVHLLHVVKLRTSASDEDVLSQRDAEGVEHAQAYLQGVREHLLAQTSDLNLRVTWSVTPAQDVAGTIVTTPEKGTGSTGENGCDVLAMATHGHGGVEQWVMGSVTERVLGASTVPVLVIRPPQDALHT
ncbi:MAG: universal stress protein [Chloroflexota bacterium]|nr:universal stress protein [Chloroflexota bacterium]